MRVGNLATPLHEHPDQGWRGVIDCHAVLFDHLEMTVLVGRVRGALVDHLGDAVGQRPVDDVGVTGDPADIGCAPIDVGLGLDVEHVVMRVRRLGQIAARGVHDALGLAGGARRVEQEQRMLGVERLRGVLGRRASSTVSCHHRSRPSVHGVSIPVRRTTRTCSTDFCPSTASSTASLSDAALPRRILAVGGDHQLGLGILDAGRQRRRGEPGEDHGVQHAEACAGQHRHDGLGQHRHVDRHPIAGHQAELGQRVGRLGHLREQLGVGDLPAVVLGLALPADRHPVAVARLDVPVDAVVGDVELAADEPLGDGGFRPVEDLGRTVCPMTTGWPARPERQPVFLGLAVQLVGRVGLRGELVRRRVCDGLAGLRSCVSVISVSVVTDVASTLASHSVRCGRRCCAPSGRLASVAVTSHPLAPLAELPGVAAASEEAREALGKAHRHRTNLRGWPTTAAEAALRAARASSVLDGGSLQIVRRTVSPTRCSRAHFGCPRRSRAARRRWSGSGRRAPLQAIARLHALAAADLVDDDRPGPSAGRRRRRAQARAAGRHGHRQTRVPAPVLAAVAHGELLTLEPFGTADGVVARAVSRLVTIASGLDPHGLGVPEVYWMRRSGDYRAAARGFASGTARRACRRGWCSAAAALHAGAREALSIADGALVVTSFTAKRSGRRSETDSARRPLARTPVTKRAGQVCVGGLGVLDDALRLQPHPRGRRGRPLFAITQARNTFAYSAACAPRGCRDPCWVA